MQYSCLRCGENDIYKLILTDAGIYCKDCENYTNAGLAILESEDLIKMDPNACLEGIGNDVQDGDLFDAERKCEDLKNWMDKGGFHPTWLAYEVGTYFYKNIYLYVAECKKANA